jgi:hypothetical protein
MKAEELKKKLRYKYYELVIALTGKTPAELKEKLPSIIPEMKKTVSPILFFFSLVISELILIQAFTPILEKFGWGTLSLPIILILIGIGCILLGIFLAGAGVAIPLTGGVGTQLFFSGIVLLLGGILCSVIFFIGSPQLLPLLRSIWAIQTAKTGIKAFGAITGTQIADLCMLFLGGVIACLAYKVGNLGKVLLPIFVFIIFFVLAKPIISASGLSKYASIERSVNVQYTVPVKTIPVIGGANVQFGTKETNYEPATLMGGEPYIYYYSIKNLYEEEEEFKIDPFIETKYMYATVRFKVDPTQVQQLNKKPYTQPISLKTNEIYSDQIFYDPRSMQIEKEKSATCYYTVSQIKKYHGIENENEIPCAYDKECTSEKTICVKTGDYMCDCLGWTALTCGGTRANMGMNIWHTGFLRANGTLFYKEEFFEPIANKRTVQGPLAVTPIFFPNPWVEKIHETYLENVKLSLEIENTGGGEIKITNAKAIPSNTEINTTVKGFSEDLNEYIEATVKEKIGINLIKCENIETTVPSGVKVYKEFCTFSKPTLEVKIINLATQNITVNAGIDVKNISKYCEKFEEVEKLDPQLRRYAKTVLKMVEKTGLCEAIEKVPIRKEEKKEEKETFAEIWKQKIVDSLKSVNVIIEINYENLFSTTSRPIEIFTSTRECLIYSCCHGGKNTYCPDGWSPDKEECKEIL